MGVCEMIALVLTSGRSSGCVLFSFRWFGSTMPRMLMDMLTRSMYDVKHAMNSITATLKRVGIESANATHKTQMRGVFSYNCCDRNRQVLAERLLRRIGWPPSRAVLSPTPAGSAGRVQSNSVVDMCVCVCFCVLHRPTITHTHTM